VHSRSGWIPTPVIPFLLLYIRGNAFHAVVSGVFCVPSKRVWGAFMDSPDIATIGSLVCLAGVLALGGMLRNIARWILVFAAGVAIAYYLISSAHDTANYRAACMPLLADSATFFDWRVTSGAEHEAWPRLGIRLVNDNCF